MDLSGEPVILRTTTFMRRCARGATAATLKGTGGLVTKPKHDAGMQTVGFDRGHRAPRVFGDGGRVVLRSERAGMRGDTRWPQGTQQEEKSALHAMQNPLSQSVGGKKKHDVNRFDVRFSNC